MLRLLQATVSASSWDHASLPAAATAGHPEVILWLRSLIPPAPRDTVSLAKALPYLDFDELQKLCNQEPDLFSPKLCAAIAYHNLGGRASNLARAEAAAEAAAPLPLGHGRVQGSSQEGGHGHAHVGAELRSPLPMGP